MSRQDPTPPHLIDNNSLDSCLHQTISSLHRTKYDVIAPTQIAFVMDKEAKERHESTTQT